MKKTLYSTTALAAAGLLTLGASDAFAQAAAPAAPEKMKLALGGFMTQIVGWSTQSDQYDGAASQTGGRNGYKNFDTKNDAEVYFTGSVKLDNGMTVSLMVQLETDAASANGGNSIDESYLTVAGDFGTFKIGEMDGNANGLAVSGAPFSGATGFASGDIGAWIVKPSSNSASAAPSTNMGPNDNNRIGYITPAFAGFRGGVGYTWGATPSGRTTTGTEGIASNGMPLKSDAEILDLGVAWGGKVSDFDLRVSYIYWNQEGSADSADTTNHNVGADVKYGDWTVGGAWKKIVNKKTSVAGTTSNPEARVWNAGVQYAPAGYAISLGYGDSRSERTTTDKDDDIARRVALGGKYTLGPGVDLVGTVARDSYNSDNQTAASQNVGYAVVGGLAVTF